MRCAFVGSLWYRSAPCMAAECVAVRVGCKKQGERQKVVHQINTKHHPQARRLQVFDHSLFLISSAPVPPAPGLDLVRQFFESILGLAGQGSRASLGLLVDVDEAGRGKWKNDEGAAGREKNGRAEDETGARLSRLGVRQSTVARAVGCACDSLSRHAPCRARAGKAGRGQRKRDQPLFSFVIPHSPFSLSPKRLVVLVLAAAAAAGGGVAVVVH